MQIMFHTIIVNVYRTLTDGRRETSVSLATATIKRIREKKNLKQFSIAGRVLTALSISVMSLNPVQTL